jgi:TadE-like protein
MFTFKLLSQRNASNLESRAPRRQRGVSIVEFLVVAPFLLFLGCVCVEFGFLMSAKSATHYGVTQAARAGAVNYARAGPIQASLVSAMVPFFGGGTNAQEILTTSARAGAELGSKGRLRMTNPSKEDFDRWGRWVPDLDANRSFLEIPNDNLWLQDGSRTAVSSDSGKTLLDANLLKLELTYGYKPKMPFVGALIKSVFGKVNPPRAPAGDWTRPWLETGSSAVTAAADLDVFRQGLYNEGRIPILQTVTVRMQTPARNGETLEPQSSAGLGNGKGSTSAGTVEARTDLASAGGANAGGFVPAFPGGSPITFGNPSPVVPPPQPPVDCTAPLAALLNPCCKPPDPNSSTCPVGCKP